VLISVSLATALTLCLMYTQDWFSVWYWPIGFGTALVFGYLASFLQPAKPTELTFFQIINDNDRV